MNKVSYKILKVLIKEREITLSHAKDLLPIVSGDYRDYYPLAILCCSGMASSGLQNENEHNEKFMASFFYAHTLGVGSHKINNYTAINKGDEQERFKINVTALGDDYQANKNSKIKERAVTTIIAFVLGIGSTIIGLWVKGAWFTN